ncbi:MAG: hypothetical protein EXS13_03135 [Planctomycetes bacterium]|nr:hypothetical protein [Planctomycetota bacterium]
MKPIHSSRLVPVAVAMVDARPFDTRPFDTLAPERRTLRAMLFSVPWFTISALFHVMLIALLAVVYVGRAKQVEPSEFGTLHAVRVAPPILPLPDVPPPPMVRDNVPALADAPPGPETIHDDYIPDAAPGDLGEFIAGQDDPTLDPGVLYPEGEPFDGELTGAPGGTPIGVGRVGHTGLAPSALATWRVGRGRKGGGGHGGNGDGGLSGGPPRAWTESTLAALVWLARHQSPDGSWDCDGFSAQCQGEACSGKGNPGNDVGVTGLALLCFLGAGHTQQEGLPRFRSVVSNGLRWLRSVQDEDGVFGSRSGQHYQYSHACASLAMAEAYGMTGAILLRDPAQRAIHWIQRSRNPYRAWRYDSADGDNDTSVTGWMTMALKSAAMAGLEIETSALRDAASYVDDMTDDAGRTGYQNPGGFSARIQGPDTERFPAERSESLTAVGLVTRIFAGRTLADDPAIKRGADLLLATRPKWNEPDIDFYYWYYGTLALFQVGGNHWEQWRKSLATELVAHQHLDRDRDDYGSWDPIDPWSSEGGRVYSTALNCLCTEVYDRYPRVFGTKLAADAKSQPASTQPK